MCFLCRLFKTTSPSTSSLTGSRPLMPAVSLICGIFATHLIKQSSAFPYLGIRNLAEPKKKNINKTDMWQSLTYSSIKFQAMEPSRINPQAASQRILEVQLFTTLPDKDPDQETMNEFFFLLYCFLSHVNQKVGWSWLFFFNNIHYLFAFKITVNAGSIKEKEASVVRVWGHWQTDTFQPDKTKLTLPGPPRCHHSMLMSWGPLSVRAVQPELRGVCEPRVDM